MEDDVHNHLRSQSICHQEQSPPRGRGQNPHPAPTPQQGTGLAPLVDRHPGDCSAQSGRGELGQAADTLLVGPTTFFSAVCGLTRKEAIYGVDFRTIRRCHPNAGRFYSPRKADVARAAAGSVRHPLPVKSPSGPLSAESRWIKPLAEEFSKEQSSRAQHQPKVRGPCPCGSFCGLSAAARGLPSTL